MSKTEHLAKLRKGVESWNRWREKNTRVVPYLRNANLRNADLGGAELFEANLSGAELREGGARRGGPQWSKSQRGRPLYSDVGRYESRRDRPHVVFCTRNFRCGM